MLGPICKVILSHFLLSCLCVRLLCIVFFVLTCISWSLNFQHSYSLIHMCIKRWKRSVRETNDKRERKGGFENMFLV